MEYVTFGRTGMKVSVAGLGCGGNSRLGQQRGESEEHSISIVRRAMDLGVNVIDTAENYRTEEIVGKAIKAVPRDQVVVTTKGTIYREGKLVSAEDILGSLEQSLRLLDTDYIDVYQLHALKPEDYEAAMETLVPALLREKEKGKFRHLGLTETSPGDHEHKMLQKLFKDDCWESIMFGFHMMHQNGRELVFPETIRQGIGTLQMFVVRNIFSQPDYLRDTMQQLVDDGKLSADDVDVNDPLGFLIHEGGATSMMDAAYRFVRHEPGANVVLFGTGNPAHVDSNIESILKPPLPKEDHERLVKVFGHLVGVGLDLPDHSKRRKQG